MAADEITEKSSVLIYPGGRWLHRSGKGMEEFGLKQINDPHLESVTFYPNAKEIFPTAAIADGVTIVVKKDDKTEPGFTYTYSKNGEETSVRMDCPGENLVPLNPKDFIITKKIDEFVSKNNIRFLHDYILPRSLFGIESDFVQNNPDSVRPYLDDKNVDFNKEIKLFTNDKAGKAGRAKWFVTDKNVIHSGREYLGKWKVVVSSANAGGQKRDNQLEIIDNHSAFGRSRVALAVFDTEKEALNFYKYVKSYVVRFAFLMTDEALTSLGKHVPDVIDYNEGNSIVKFDTSIDEQLFSMIKLSDDEIAYVKERVDNIRSKE